MYFWCVLLTTSTKDKTTRKKWINHCKALFFSLGPNQSQFLFPWEWSWNPHQFLWELPLSPLHWDADDTALLLPQWSSPADAQGRPLTSLLFILFFVWPVGLAFVPCGKQKTNMDNLFWLQRTQCCCHSFITSFLHKSIKGQAVVD